MPVLERCDPNTMTVFNTAMGQARRFGHNYLGTEHLLLSLVLHRDLLPAGVAGLLPSDPAVVSAALEAFLGGPPPGDAELLKTLGIDLTQVRAAVRQTFGNDALERLGRRRVHQPWQPWRRPTRRCMSLLAGPMAVAPRVKQAFEHARDHAGRRGRETIDPAGLLLGMVEVEGAVSNRLLQEAGIDPGDVRRAVLDEAS
jgi:ATP-dependent Clp protease ATP-binding subunit ClpA